MSLCRAKSSRTGAPCKKQAIKGGVVCEVHGGAAPHVRAAALARIQAMVPTALNCYESIMKSGEDNDKRYVARDILDRAGYKEPDKIQLSGHDGGPLVDMSQIKGTDPELLDKLGAIFAAALAKHPQTEDEDLA